MLQNQNSLWEIKSNFQKFLWLKFDWNLIEILYISSIILKNINIKYLKKDF